MKEKIPTSLVMAFLLLFTGTAVNAQSAYFQAVTNLGPVGYWPMHETTSPVQGCIETNYGTLGALGAGYYPDWINPGQTAIKRGAVGALVGDSDTAVYFTGAGASNRGSTTNALYVPHLSPLSTLTPPFSVECWFYPTNNNQNDVWGQAGAAGLNNGANWAGIRLYWNPGFIVYAYDGNSGSALRQIGSIGAPYNTVGQWYHLVLTADANTNVSLYINDALVFSNPAATLFSPDYWTPFMVGCSRGVSRAVAGIIDEVALYTNDLSAATIDTHYNYATNGPAGQYMSSVLAGNPTIYLRMDSPTYSAPAASAWTVMTNYGNVAGNGAYLPGTVPGNLPGPGSDTGVPYAGLATPSATNVAQFSGVNSFAVAGYATEYNPIGSVPFSVMAMFKGNPADPLRTWQTLVGHSDNSWRIAMNVNGKLQWQLGTNTTSSLNSTRVCNDGKWHQVVGVYSPSTDPNVPGTNALYVDGLLDAVTTSVHTNGIGPGSTLNVLIGSDPQFTNNPAGIGRQFAGQICEVALFTNALSESQVRALYGAVGAPPQILIQPVSANANQNSAFTNTVVALGSEPKIYQWYKDGSPRSGQTSASLVLSSVQPTDAGNWYVVVTNTYGTATSATVTLTVNSAPVVTPTAVTNLRLFAGGHANLTVSAAGAQPLIYQWFSNSVAITGATNASYTLSNAQLGTSTFYCQVTNFVGTASSAPVSVTVIAGPTTPYPVAVLADNPQGYWRLNESDNGLANGNAGESVFDYWGGDNGSYTNVSLGQSGYNTITDPTETSAQFGLSSPFVDSYAGSINGVDFAATNASATFSIEAWVNGTGQVINGAGIVTKGYGNGGEEFCIDYNGAANGMRFFVRNAAGTAINCLSGVSPDGAWHHVVGVCDEPNGVVSLYVDGLLKASSSIASGSGIRTSTGPMVIGARKSASTSTYYNNQYYGNVNDVAVYNKALTPEQIRAHYTAAGTPPVLTQVPAATVTANEGGPLTIAAAAIGTPPLTNTWYDINYGTNVSQVIVATNAVDGTLTISAVPPGWVGDSLQLTVANAYGSATAVVGLSVVSGPPVFIKNLPPTAMAVEGKAYTYSVAVNGAYPLNYQWYSNNVALAGQTSSSYTFAASPASYRVLVSNSYGSINSTTSVLTTVPQLTNSYASAILGAGAAGYWPLQESAAAAPITVETNLGTLGDIGNAYYASANVTLGQGGALTGGGDNDGSVAVAGTTTSYLFLPRKNATLTLLPPLTMECWMQPTTGSGTADLISEGGSGLNSAPNAGNFGGFRISFGGSAGDGDTLQFFAYDANGGTLNGGNTNIQTAAASITRNAWNHCVATYDGANVALYINGQLLATGTTPYASDTWTPLTIGGGRWQGQSPTRRFTGFIDEVAIYTNVLTQTQIQNHYAAATSAGNYRQTIENEQPILYYRMDSPSYITPDPLTYPTALNFGSAIPNGFYVGGVVPGGISGPTFAGMPGNLAAPINGIFSGVDAGFDAAFNPTGTQPFTAMAWFRGYPGDGRLQTIMSHGVNWALNLDGTTGLVAWNPGSANVSSSTILNDGNWHFVAGVFDGSSASLYVDGALNASAAAAPLTADSTNNVMLGGNAAYTTLASNQRYLAGALAHAAVFTNALSASQIGQIYAMTVPVTPTISLTTSGGQLVITYTGTLLSATTVNGPYSPVVGASSPYNVPVDGPQRFYRTSNP